jgi:hypothetical protein
MSDINVADLAEKYGWIIKAIDNNEFSMDASNRDFAVDYVSHNNFVKVGKLYFCSDKVVQRIVKYLVAEEDGKL